MKILTKKEQNIEKERHKKNKEQNKEQNNEQNQNISKSKIRMHTYIKSGDVEPSL